TQQLDCRFLELRHEVRYPHQALTSELTSKVHMRLALPATTAQLRAALKAKVRNQVKKGESQGFDVDWGGRDCLDHFYTVFSRNMRDLGTPVYGRSLFRSVLDTFGDHAELCIVRDGAKPVAGALLIH